MEENRSRGSPRLQFSREELENEALSRTIQKAEKAADKYEAAQKKLKRYRVRLTLENRESETASSSDAQQSMHAEDLSAFQTERDSGIQSDPSAPAVLTAFCTGCVSCEGFFFCFSSNFSRSAFFFASVAVESGGIASGPVAEMEGSMPGLLPDSDALPVLAFSGFGLCRVFWTAGALGSD